MTDSHFVCYIVIAIRYVLLYRSACWHCSNFFPYLCALLLVIWHTFLLRVVTLLLLVSSGGWRWRLKTFCRHLRTSLMKCLRTASTTGAESLPSMLSPAGWLGTAAVAGLVTCRQWAKRRAVIQSRPEISPTVPVITWPSGYRPGYGSRVDGWVVGAYLSYLHGIGE